MENFKGGDEPIYTINQVSQIKNLSKPTIRYYEDIGLLSEIKIIFACSLTIMLID
jgi:hypothetical protein